MIAVWLAVNCIFIIAALATDAWARHEEISKAEAYREWRRALGL